MKEVLIVFAGGGLGSICRYLTGKLLAPWQAVFPFATLVSNFLSCLIFGVVVMLGVNRLSIDYPTKLFLITGFCGGFSTYSAFTFETVELFRNNQGLLAAGNIALNFLISVAGLYLGMFLVKALG